MAFFVYFHFQKIFIYFFFRAISFLGRRIIKMYYPELFINPIFYLFIMFLGESLSVFLFIILKIKLIKSRKTKKFEIQYESFLKRLLKILYSPFLIFFCSFCDFCGSFNYSYYYSYKMLKFSDNYNNLNKIILCLFVTYNEIYFLNIQNYIHNIIGLIIINISLIFVVICSLIRNLNELHFFSFFIFFIISLEQQYIESILYTIEKKLNYEYFVDIYKICFYEGILGIILTLFYNLLSVKLFKKDYFFFMYSQMNSKLIGIIFIYCVLTLIYNLCRLKISEKRPSLNIIGDILSFLFLDIYDSIVKNEIWTIETFISTIFSLIGSFIFCEIMTLNFWDLDKFTKEKTTIRAIDDANKSIITNENSFETFLDT